MPAVALPAGAGLDDTPVAGVSGDQLDGFPPGSLEAVLDRLAGAGRDRWNRRPVPRRPWLRVWCWAAGGHFWFPDVSACLDCGKDRRRAPVRGDR